MTFPPITRSSSSALTSETAPEFLVNDPASRPFLQVSGRELFDTRPFQKWSPDNAKAKMHVMRIISATPKEVRLPLLDDYMETTRNGAPSAAISWGLFRIIDELQMVPESPLTKAAVAAYGSAEAWEGEFRLLNLAAS